MNKSQHRQSARLIIDPSNNLAAMTFLGQDMRTISPFSLARLVIQIVGGNLSRARNVTNAPQLLGAGEAKVVSYESQ